MTIATLPETTEKLVLSPVSSSYVDIGDYKHSGYSINFSPILIRTGKNYSDSRQEIPEGLRMSTAGEELAIQLGLERARRNPRKAKEFDDLFGRNDEGWYAWQWTETGLRVPKGRDPDKYETDSNGRKYWVRTVLVEDQEVGEILVPKGNGRVVVELDEVFGIPRVTSDKDGDMEYDNHTTHFWFNTNPDKDSTSGQYDVAVGRGGSWHHDAHSEIAIMSEGCLGVDARCGRWDASSRDGFRLVRGSLPEIEAEFARADPQTVENLKERIDADAASLTRREFEDRYQL